MTRIALLDYGMGNLHSAAKALEHVGATVDVTADPQVVRRADKIVFPGVGAMRDCMSEMERTGIADVVREQWQQKPFLAICVGMQAMLERSAENNGVAGLGLIAGQVNRFADQAALKVPHMGWNTVNPVDSDHPLWRGIAPDSYFYFVHSYFVEPLERGLVTAYSTYAAPFACALGHDNWFATQFHPEKSHTAGLQLLKNFVEWMI